MAFTSAACVTEDKGDNTRLEESTKAFTHLMARLDKQEIHPLKISWEEGVVILKRNNKEIKRIEEFVPVSTRKRFKDKNHHTGVYPWEQYITEQLGIRDGWRINFQKDRLAYYKKALGGSPKTYVRELQACMFKAFIPEDLRDVVHKYCRTGGRREWVKEQVTSVPKKASILRQMIKDGQTNILPFALASENEDFNIRDFRKSVGKSVWKTLVKNSTTRNHLMCETARNTRSGVPFITFIDYPSTLLKNRQKDLGVYPMEAVNLMKKARVLGKKEEHHKYVQIIRDTKSMYKQLERVIPKQSSKWDLSKWEEKHAWCVEQINLKKYSKTPFEWMNGMHKTFNTDKGYSAEILDNAFSIRTEGDVMKHCVGSYSDRVKDKRYMVISIKDKEGKNYSTLGCYKEYKTLRIKCKNKSVFRGLGGSAEMDESTERLVFNQHYRHCNQSVQDEYIKDFATWLIIQINKQLKGEHYETTYKTEIAEAC
tara:strand:- start:4463 stop:5908 length:1446 start_codon:yes stop_codon:yes gene_type:complete